MPLPTATVLTVYTKWFVIEPRWPIRLIWCLSMQFPVKLQCIRFASFTYSISTFLYI